MAQERMQPTGSGATDSVSSLPNAPDISGVLARATRAIDKVRVVSGSNEQYHNLAGKNVGSVRKNLRDVFNIAGDAVSIVDGKEVGDDFILTSGQTLEFVKEAGVKGNAMTGILDDLLDELVLPYNRKHFLK